jgi:hypothetical protein
MLALVHTACIFFYKHSACIEHVTNTGEPLLPSHDVYVGQAADPACHCQRRGCLSSTSVVRFPLQGRLWHGSRQTGSGFSSPVRHYDVLYVLPAGAPTPLVIGERAGGATLERLRRLLAATVDGGGTAGAPPNRFEFRTLIFIAFTVVSGSAYFIRRIKTAVVEPATKTNAHVKLQKYPAPNPSGCLEDSAKEWTRALACTSYFLVNPHGPQADNRRKLRLQLFREKN